MKLSRILGFALVAFCVIALVAAAVLVADTPRPAGSGEKSNEFVNNPATGTQKNSQGLPPNEAILSCTGKSTGEVCQFKDGEGLTSGVCDDKPGVLACAPERDRNAGQMSNEKPAPQGIDTPPGNVPSGTTPSGNVKSASVPSNNVQSAQVNAGEDKGSFSLTSDAGPDGSTLPIEYSCDGSGATPALSWSGAPAGTQEFALMMTTVPVDGSTRWNWVLYSIPGTTTGLFRSSTGVGIVGTGSHGTIMMYDPPCPQGPGAKTYTITLYALSTSPSLPASADQVTGEVLTSAISSITLGKASLSMSYSRE